MSVNVTSWAKSYNISLDKLTQRSLAQICMADELICLQVHKHLISFVIIIEQQDPTQQKQELHGL